MARPRLSHRPTRPVSMLIESAQLDRFDAVAKAMGLNRSEAMRQMMAAWCDQHADLIPSQESLPISA